MLDTTTAEIFISETPENSSYGFSIKMEIGRSQHWHLFFNSTGKLFYYSVLSDCVQFTILLEANRQCEARHEMLKSSVPEMASSAHQHDSSPSGRTKLSPALCWEFKAIPPHTIKHQRHFLSRISNTRKSIIDIILLVAVWKKLNIHCIYTAHAYPLHWSRNVI